MRMDKLVQFNYKVWLDSEDRGLLDLYPVHTPKVGDEVYWIDPCYWRGEEHASKWGTITSINDEIITLDYNTEVLLEEIYY